jgi:hypothetical protein
MGKIAMTFIFDRYHVDTVDEPDIEETSDGEYVLAEDAINREAVNADRIRLLEVQLKEAKAACPSNKAAAVAVGEPIYQKSVCIGLGIWKDLSAGEFKSLARYNGNTTRIVYAAPPAPIASAEEAVPVAEVVLFGGDVKEVAWTKGKMPEVGTKLYTHPAAAQPSRAEDK